MEQTEKPANQDPGGIGMSQEEFMDACNREHHMGLAFIKSRMSSGRNPAVVLFSTAMAAAIVSRSAFAGMATDPVQREAIVQNFHSIVSEILNQPYPPAPEQHGGPFEVPADG